jgi:hypothetical protein
MGVVACPGKPSHVRSFCWPLGFFVKVSACCIEEQPALLCLCQARTVEGAQTWDRCELLPFMWISLQPVFWGKATTLCVVPGRS